MTAIFSTRRSLLRRSALAVASLAVSGPLSALPACAEEPHPHRAPYNTLSDEDEIALGKILATNLEKDLQLVSSYSIDIYLKGLMDKLAAVSQRPTLPYHCRLVNSMEINAFSIAGGGVYLNRGLVEFATSEDQLAAALAHEIGHVVGRHSTNEIMLTFQARRAYDLVRNNIPAHSQMIQNVIEKLGGTLALLAMLHYSRENEFEADMLGFYEMLRAGYEPAGMLDLFQKFTVLENQPNAISIPFLRDHPPAEDRATSIRQELQQVSVPAGASADSFRFHAFKLSMNLLPKPRESARP